MSKTAVEVSTMPRPKSDRAKKPPMVTVKIEAELHSTAKAIVGFTGEKIEDLLSNLLRHPLEKLLDKVVAEYQKSKKPAKEDE